MPTPINYNNIAYARQYKAVNVVEDNKAYLGDEGFNDYYQLKSLEAVKGSVDLPSDKGTNQPEGFFTQHTTASVASQAGLIVENYYACLPYSLAGRNSDEE